MPVRYESQFQIGDFIEANEDSNYEYGITNRNNGWRGYVVRINTTEEKNIGVVSDRHFHSENDDPEFWVSDKFFDLIPMDELSLPDENLFSALFC